MVGECGLTAIRNYALQVQAEIADRLRIHVTCKLISANMTEKEAIDEAARSGANYVCCIRDYHDREDTVGLLLFLNGTRPQGVNPPPPPKKTPKTPTTTTPTKVLTIADVI